MSVLFCWSVCVIVCLDAVCLGGVCLLLFVCVVVAVALCVCCLCCFASVGVYSLFVLTVGCRVLFCGCASCLRLCLLVVWLLFGWVCF